MNTADSGLFHIKGLKVRYVWNNKADRYDVAVGGSRWAITIAHGNIEELKERSRKFLAPLFGVDAYKK